MPLPETVRVKLSPETAGYLSIEQVVARDMPLRELVEMMLGVAGKDLSRVHELLLRGTLVSGASRLRWLGWDADAVALGELLAGFPDPDPTRPFDSARCILAILKGPGARIEISRTAGLQRRMFRRRSFWEVLMRFAAEAPAGYTAYSYKERCDLYRLEVTLSIAEELRLSAPLLRYSQLEAQISRAAPETIDFFVARGG